MKFVLKDPTDPKHNRYSFVDIPEKYRELADEYHAKLLDAASLGDDHMTELLLEGKEVPEDVLRKAIRSGTLGNRITPVHCGSSKTYHGVQLLLDAVIDYLPSPIDRGSVTATVIAKGKEKTVIELKPEATEPFSGLAFKTVSEPTGDLVYVRIYSGEMRPKDDLWNASIGRDERVARIFRMMGDRRDSLDVAGPGEIVAVVGLKQTFTGHTLSPREKPVVLEMIRFPEPVISQALIPDRTTDETKLGDAIGKLVRDDPTLRCKTDPETNQLILSGMGELHLEVSVDKLQRTPGVKVSVGKPMVAYRQTLSKPLKLETRYIKQTGGRGKYAVIYMEYEPLNEESIAEYVEALEEEGEKPDPNHLYFEDKIAGGVVPREYIPSVEDGFRDGCVKGQKYGFPCVKIKVALTDGKYHDVDSSQDAFRLAAMENFRDAQAQAGITLLEPIMKVVAVAPSNYLGDLTRDVSRRRGEILDTSMDKGRCQLTAFVPLGELFGYTTEIRNFTSGTASFTMEPSHYAPVKEELADLSKPEKK